VETVAQSWGVSIMTQADFVKAKTGKAYKTGDTGPAGGIFLSMGLLTALEIAPTDGDLNGWRLPKKDELDAMYRQLKMKGLGGFSNDWYEGSSEGAVGLVQNFSNGERHEWGREDLWAAYINFNRFKEAYPIRVRRVRELLW